MDVRKTELLKRALAQNAFPDKVYKYRGPDLRTLDILTKQQLWFASPHTFNDPFDCRLSEVQSHARGDVESYVDSLDLKKSERDAVLEQFDQDPSIARQRSIDARNKVIANRGVLSLSRNFDTILMWSHYAQNHTGLVLGFEIAKDLDFFSTPLNVKYSQAYAELNYFKDRMDSITRNISSKSVCWEYEAELRVMKDKVAAVSFDPLCLTQVYFGCAADKTFIEQVRAICLAGSLAHVEFFQANVRHGEFALDFTRI